MAWRDARDWVKALTAEKQQRLGALLQVGANVSLEDEEKVVIERVRQVRQRGRIKTEDEYRTVVSYLEHVSEGELKPPELRAYENLLANFGKDG